VGDWVEIYGKQYLITGKPYIEDNDWLCRNVNGNQEKYHDSDITRILSPSEVRVRISLEGTVNVCISNVGTDCFSLKTKNTWYAIHYNDLDPATAEMVRELIKAQEKGE
jgi:hypothetical protein